MLVTKPHTACLQIVKVVVPTKKADRTHADYGFVHFEERQAAVTLVEAAERAQDPLILKFPEGTENVLQVCSRPGCERLPASGQHCSSLQPLPRVQVSPPAHHAMLPPPATLCF